MGAQSIIAPFAALAASVLVTSVAAAQAGRPVVDASFVSRDRTGCVSTEVSVLVRGDGTGGNPGSGKAKVSLAITEVDECRDEVLLSAAGKANLGDGAFRLSPDLRSATLNTTVPVLDRVANKRFGATVQLAWKAVETAVEADISVEPDESGRAVRLKVPAHRTLRLAEASGVVAEGERKFTPLPAIDAAISVVVAKTNKG